MNKSLIALAIAALSSNAFATDFTHSPVEPVKYASEITLPADLSADVTADLTGTSLDADFALGFSATQGVKRYVRFDLTNAKFKDAVVAGDLKVGAVVLNDSISKDGTVGSSSVVIEITPATTLANDAKLTLNMKHITATGGDIGIKYRLYETGVAAAAGNNETLASASGTLVSFASGVDAKVIEKGAEQKIDVTQSSKFFYDDAAGHPAGDKTNDIGTLKVEAVSGVYAVDGTAVTLAKLMASAKLEVSGDFSAGKKDADGKLVSAAADFDGVVAASTVTADKATFDFAATDTGGILTYTVDGATAITTQTMTAKLVPVAKAGYTLSTINFGDLGELTKNGSSQEANLVLAPDTAYTNLVRISNTSGIAGKFFITAVADDGKNVTFPLSDVAGQPASLNAGASTTQMKVKDIFAAAEAKGLALTGEKKLRLKVEGEVGSLSLQTYTVSKDGNALNSLNAF